MFCFEGSLGLAMAAARGQRTAHKTQVITRRRSPFKTRIARRVGKAALVGTLEARAGTDEEWQGL